MTKAEDGRLAELIAAWQAGHNADELLLKLADELDEVALPAPALETCGVVGDPPLGEHEGPLTCELSRGHDGYHRSGRITWIGYFAAPAPAQPEAEVSKAALEEAIGIIRAIMYASDDCQGHRGCQHSMTPWQDARALLLKVDNRPTAPPASPAARPAEEETR